MHSKKTRILKGFTALALLLSLSLPSLAQQGRTVKLRGTVTDESGEPIIGAGIIEKGNSSNGSVSDFEGKFELTISSSATVTVSCIGYASQEVALDGRSIISIILSEDTRVLEESVVIGYGVQKKANLTGAVATISLQDEESRPITHIASAMNSAAPGLQVLQGSGQPLEESNAYTIRGIGTLNTSTPLILTDGMEITLSSVDPADIASITVLKDAAACAIYGNRGANGVILLTTKSGSTGKAKISYDANFSYNEPVRVVKAVSDNITYMKLMNESSENLGNAAYYSQSSFDLWEAANADPNGLASSGYPNYVAYPNTDWWDWIYTNQWQQKHTFSVSGSQKGVGYLVSFSYIDNPGTIKNTGYQRYIGRINFYADVTDWFRIGTRTTANVTDVDLNYGISDVLEGNYTKKVIPSTYPYYDGYYGAPEGPEDDPEAYNILYLLQQTKGYDKRTQLYTNMYATVKFLDHFTYDYNLYYKNEQQERQRVTSASGKYNFSTATWSVAPSDPSTMSTYMYYKRTTDVKMNHVVNYSQSFGDHEVTALVGYEQEKYVTRYTNVGKLGLVDEAVSDLSAATELISATGTGSEYTAMAFMGRVTYNYKGKYLFEADFRYDGSSRFAPEYRWGFFPSFSAGWRMSEETFLKGVPWLTNLKLRASWGELGNNSIGNYEWQSTYGSTNYSFGQTSVSGIAITAISNYSLTWESTAITNIGVDFGMFGNRLSGTFEVYNKFTDGILYAPTTNLVMGYADAPTQNLAEVTNRGVELELTWKDSIGRDFHYSVTGQFSYNRNRVTKYLGELEQGYDEDGNWTSNIGDVSTGSTTKIIEGKQINEFYLLNVYKGNGTYYYTDGTVNPNGGPKDGMIRTEADMAWVKAMIAAGYSFQPYNNVTKAGLWYGEYIYADVNGDGIYGSSYDYTFQGTSTNPKYNFGLTMSADYKNFDLSMSWGGAAGFSIYYYEGQRNSSETTYGYAIPQSVADDHYFYDPDNPLDSRTNLTSKNSRLVNMSDSQTDASSNLHLEKGDYLKLRNLTFGYTLPEKITRKAFISRLRVYFSGENLLLITGFSGQDPEQRTTMAYSTTRQYSFGLNLTF